MLLRMHHRTPLTGGFGRSHRRAVSAAGSSQSAVRAARRVRLVEAADRVVKVRDREQRVVRRPSVVEAVSPDPGKSAARQLGDLLIRERVPLVDDDRIVLIVVRAGAGARVEKRNRLVKIVNDDGLPVRKPAMKFCVSFCDSTIPSRLLSCAVYLPQ